MAQQVTSKKATFSIGTDAEYQVFWNGKEYGAKRTIYLDISKLSGVQGPSRTKGSFSLAEMQFVDFKAGEREIMRGAARALGIIE